MAKAKSENGKEYVIQGKTLTLEKVTLGQVKGMLKLFQDLDIQPETKMTDVVDVLIQKKIDAFADVIFGGQAKGIKWDQVPYDDFDQIVEDFLALNPRLKNRLMGLFGSLASLAAPATRQ